MNYILKNKELENYNEIETYSFPKYTSQLINWANQNAQGTRPAVVGQMSDLFPEFMRSAEKVTPADWAKWYGERYPDTLEKATDKICAQIENLKCAIRLIDREMVQRWVKDLVLFKTFSGLYVQKAVLASLAERTGESYRLAVPAEEAKGVDGYVGNTPYSIKPNTYKTMGRLSEKIEVKMIYYIKTKAGLKIEVED